jgi:hypothetical protein
MLTAKGRRVRRVRDPAVAEEARGGVPATTMTPTGRSNQAWSRTTRLGPRAEW